MVATINPAVYWGNRKLWRRCVALHFLGTAVGSASIAAAIGFSASFGGLSSSAARWISIGVLVIAIVFDVGLLPTNWLSISKKQVPERWRRKYRPEKVALLYGVGLGLTFTTRVYFGLTYAGLILSGLLWGPVIGTLIGAAMGLARASIVLMGRRVNSPGELVRFIDRSTALRRTVQVVAVAAGMCGLAVVLTSVV